jgi:hypothetical protein
MFLYFKSIFKKIKKKLVFSLLQINIFLMFLDHFDALISKIIFLKIKEYYFNTFSSKKYFKKQL